jgi:hypothetical protein
MRVSELLVLVLVLLSSTAARAQNEAAYEALNKGIELYRLGAYPAARDQFVEANRLAPTSANAYRWLGLTEVKLDRCTDALWHLDVFVKMVKPDDKRLPEVTAALGQCRDALKPRSGVLTVDSDPPGAEVRLDDPKSPSLGLTPYRNDAVGAGDHRVFLSRAGFVTESRPVSVVVEQPATLRVQLTEAPAPLVAPSTATKVTESPRRKPRYWIAGVVAGVVGAAALGIGLGVGLSSSSAPIGSLGPAIQLK